MTNQAIALAARISALFNRLDIDYVVGGSVAGAAVGEARATIDLDVAVQLDREQGAALLELASVDFYVPTEAAAYAIDYHDSFNLIQLDGPMKVDVFVLGDDQLDVWHWSDESISTSPASTVACGSLLRPIRCCASSDGSRTAAAAPTANGATCSASSECRPCWTAPAFAVMRTQSDYSNWSIRRSPRPRQPTRRREAHLVTRVHRLNLVTSFPEAVDLGEGLRHIR